MAAYLYFSIKLIKNIMVIKSRKNKTNHDIMLFGAKLPLFFSWLYLIGLVMFFQKIL